MHPQLQPSAGVQVCSPRHSGHRLASRARTGSSGRMARRAAGTAYRLKLARSAARVPKSKPVGALALAVLIQSGSSVTYASSQ